MGLVYSFFKGRKMFIFFLLLVINAILAGLGKFSADFGSFCIMLSGVYVVGNVGEKLSEAKKVQRPVVRKR